MMKAWTVPEPVEVTQWWPQLGILRGTQGTGCWQCGSKPCNSSAHHEPIVHPHHLEIQTWKGPAAIFPSDYLIVYRDGRMERVTAVEYAQRFSETPFVPITAPLEQVEKSDGNTSVVHQGYSLSAAESVTVTAGQAPE